MALSGGAAFGAYQVGVWRALSERGWQPDVTTGISIGAVNAWLLARGVSCEALEAIWFDWPAELLPDLEDRFALPWRAHVPMFRAWIERIANEYGSRSVVCDGRITMLEAPAGRLHTISVAEAGPAELLAACALPGIIAPVRTQHGLFLDCGIVRYKPIPETIEAGADDIVLVDLLAAHPFPPVRRVRRAVLAALRRLAGAAPEPTASPDVRITVVGHHAPLGGVLECFRWTRSFAERLASHGYRDACSALEGRRHKTKTAPAHAMKPSPVSVAPQ